MLDSTFDWDSAQVVDVPPRGREEHGAYHPHPSIDKGVEFRVDWLTVTIYSPLDLIKLLLSTHFGGLFKLLVDGHHGRWGYNTCLEGNLGFEVLYNVPIEGLPAVDVVDEHATLKFPGLACSAISPAMWCAFFAELQARSIRFNATRLDLAFDNVPFNPLQFHEAVAGNQIRSLAKRDTLKWVTSAFKPREDGSGLGCDTCYFGSRASGRMVRVYNMHGPTRLELELKSARAALVARVLFDAPTDRWIDVAISHVRDFIDVSREWWAAFVAGVPRAFAKLTDPVAMTVKRLSDWVMRQVAPSLSVLVDCYKDDKLLDRIIGAGRKCQNEFQKALIAEFANRPIRQLVC